MFLSTVIGLTLAAAAFANSVVNVTRTTNPAVALAMPFSDAIALAASADQRVTADPRALLEKDVELAARRSLVGQAANPRALRLLGYVLAEHGDQVSGRRLIRLAERASRREVSAQFWLIEDCVSRSNVSCALEHYDVAMRTQPDVRRVLFPVLTQAMSEPEVRRTLAGYMRGDPSWLYDFVNYATATLTEPWWLSTTLTKAGGLPKDSIYRPLETNLLGQLVAKNEFDAARKYADSLSSGAIGKAGTLGFTALTIEQRFAPLTWQLKSTPTTSVTFEDADDKNGFTLHIVAGTGDRLTVLSRLLFLTPGTYQMNVGQLEGEISPDSTLTWMLRCAVPAERRLNWSAALKEGRSAAFVVPAGCPAIMLDLNVSSGSAQEGLDIRVSKINLYAVPPNAP